MNGRVGQPHEHRPKDPGKAPKPAPHPDVPEEEEEDGDIATPKRDRDDEAAGSD